MSANESQQLQQQIDELERKLQAIQQLHDDRLNTLETEVSRTQIRVKAERPNILYNRQLIQAGLSLLAALVLALVPRQVAQDVSAKLPELNQLLSQIEGVLNVAAAGVAVTGGAAALKATGNSEEDDGRSDDSLSP